MVGGGDAFYLKFWVNHLPWNEIADFQSIFARSASAVASGGARIFRLPGHSQGTRI